MPRRLPLLRPLASVGTGAGAGAATSHDDARCFLGPGSIGIADTDTGLAAAEWAVELALELVTLDRFVTIVLLGFQGIPRLPAQLASKLPASRSSLDAFAVDPLLPVVPSLSARGSTTSVLWLGLPALASFEPDLAVLLAADRPLTSWPAPLRARRGGFSLELSFRRPGLARTLAGSLNDSGFLLRG